MNELTERLCNYLNQYGEFAILTTELDGRIAITTCSYDGLTGSPYVEYYDSIEPNELLTVESIMSVLECTNLYRIDTVDSNFGTVVNNVDIMLSNYPVVTDEWYNAIQQYAISSDRNPYVFALQ